MACSSWKKEKKRWGTHGRPVRAVKCELREDANEGGEGSKIFRRGPPPLLHARSPLLPRTFNLRANLAHVDLLAAVPCALQGYRAPLSFDCVRSHLSLTVNPSIVLFRSFPIKTREESCLRSGRIFKF